MWGFVVVDLYYRVRICYAKGDAVHNKKKFCFVRALRRLAKLFEKRCPIFCALSATSENLRKTDNALSKVDVLLPYRSDYSVLLSRD